MPIATAKVLGARGDVWHRGEALHSIAMALPANDPLALISADPLVCHGQACVRGTRIPVSVILDCLAEGMTEAELLAGYPTLTVEGIRAAAAYGGLLARDEFVVLRPES